MYSKKEYAHQWYLKNKARCRRNYKKWVKNNRHRYLEYPRLRHIKFKKERLAYDRLWRKKNKDKVRLYAQRKDALKRKAGKLTVKIIQQIYEENIKFFKTLTCIYCLEPIKFGDDTLEHKMPLSRGGTNKKSNLGIACKKCNTQKGVKTPKEYKEWLFYHMEVCHRKSTT